MTHDALAFTLLPYESRMLDASAGYALEVSHGRLWVTRPADAADYFLDAGRSLELREKNVLISCDVVPGNPVLQTAHYRLRPLTARRQTRKSPGTLLFQGLSFGAAGRN